MANVFGLDTIDDLDVSTLCVDGVLIDKMFVKISDTIQQNTNTQLLEYVTTSVLKTTLAGYQRTINNSNTIPYSFISSPPDLTNFVTNTVLSSYVTNTNLQTTLNAYQKKLATPIRYRMVTYQEPQTSQRTNH